MNSLENRRKNRRTKIELPTTKKGAKIRPVVSAIFSSERILSTSCENLLFVELQPRELENEYRYILKYVVALNLIKIRK